MKSLKQVIDDYFGLEHETEGQTLYYGTITLLTLMIVGVVIANFAFHI